MVQNQRTVMALAALACLFVAPAAWSQTRQQIEAAEKVVRESAERFRAVIEDVDEEQWNLHPTGIRHSIGEEAEHVAFAEQELQRMILRALEAPESRERAADLAGKEKTLQELMLDPATTAENYRARGKLITKAEVLEYFDRAGRSLLQLLKNTPNLSLHITKHPSKKYGDLTALQWFYYIAYHKLRHCRQIETIKSHPDYPGRVQKALREPTRGEPPAGRGGL